jgi:hypothetical protein
MGDQHRPVGAKAAHILGPEPKIFRLSEMAFSMGRIPALDAVREVLDSNRRPGGTL